MEAIEHTVNGHTTHTIECVCGYIATFEDWKWTCPNCGRGYSHKQSRLGPHFHCCHVPDHLVKKATIIEISEV
jgi:hypothetical protein